MWNTLHKHCVEDMWKLGILYVIGKGFNKELTWEDKKCATWGNACSEYHVQELVDMNVSLLICEGVVLNAWVWVLELRPQVWSLILFEIKGDKVFSIFWSWAQICRHACNNLIVHFEEITYTGIWMRLCCTSSRNSRNLADTVMLFVINWCLFSWEWFCWELKLL